MGKGPEVTPAAYGVARRTLLEALGRKAIADFHRSIPLLDWVVVVVLPTVFFINAFALATWTGLPWLALLVVQGATIQLFGYAVHDLFIHRRLGGDLGYYVAALFELPITFRRTWHALYHIDHHEAMNTDADPEAYKQDLDTRMKRFFFLTLPGAMLAMSGRLRSSNSVSPHVAMAPSRPFSNSERRQLVFEGVLLALWAATLSATGLIWWELPVFGYLLPLALVTPLLSGLRTLLEHAECDGKNVFHCATFYRTGWITGPLFFWDAGDCHLVHHIYPAIPFYRMPAAVRAMSPILAAHGARERRSLLELLYGWFYRNEPHRTVWSR